MPDGNKRADYGPNAPLPPELNPRRGRTSGRRTQFTVSDLQARNPDVAASRGRHRTRRPEQQPLPVDDGFGPTTFSGNGYPADQRHPRRAQRAERSRPGGSTGALRRGALIGGRIVLVLLSIGALIGSGIAWATYRQFTQGIQHGVALPKAPQGKKGDVDGKDENILLLGNDSIAGATPAEVAALGTTPDRSDAATDTMMILHIPSDGSKATIISVPRDSWVAIPGHGMDKINAAYIDGFNDAAAQGAKDLLTKQSAGIVLAAQTLTDLTGLHIDHYVQINLLGFYEISEAIGGVNLCLNEAQNKYTEGDASHPNGYSGINLKKGWNYDVKGTQALAFVRQRHGFPDGRGDIDRIARQQYFLSAVFHKAVSSKILFNPIKLSALLDAVKKSLVTDPSLDILQFVQQFSKIAGGNITFGTPPWQFGQVGNQDVVLVDPAAVKQYIDRMIGVPVDKKLATAKAVPPRDVSVSVLNESNHDLVATKNAGVLSQAGFLATVGDTNQHTERTTIMYPDGMQAQAKTLSHYVPGATLEQSGSVSTVTLILGSDGIQAKPGVTQPARQSPSSASSEPKPKPTATPSGVTNAAQNAKSCID